MFTWEGDLNLEGLTNRGQELAHMRRGGLYIRMRGLVPSEGGA